MSAHVRAYQVRAWQGISGQGMSGYEGMAGHVRSWQGRNRQAVACSRDADRKTDRQTDRQIERQTDVTKQKRNCQRRFTQTVHSVGLPIGAHRPLTVFCLSLVFWSYPNSNIGTTECRLTGEMTSLVV
jgi:hypothetical protein